MNNYIRKTYRFYKQYWKKLYYNIFPGRYIKNYQPIYMVKLELSSTCNLQCTFCTQRLKKHSGMHMSYEKAVEYYNKLPKTIEYIELHFSGESFLNPEIGKIVGFLSQKGIFTSVSTNGTLPAGRYIETLQNGLSQLIFAIDGATPQTHEKYRVGSNLNKIIKTFREVLEKKPDGSKVGVQYLVTKYSENEIGSMKKMLKEMGADFLNLKPISLNIGSNEDLESRYEKLRNAQEFLPSDPKYSRYYYKNKHLILKRPRIFCSLIYEPSIGADGEVCLCTEDIDKQVKIGNLNDYESFKDLWETKNYQDIRKNVLNKRLSICKNCNYNFYDMIQINFK